MKHLPLFLLLFAGVAVSAQDVPVAAGDYDKISMKFGNLLLSFVDKPELKELTGGATIVLKSKKEGVKDLPIKADSIHFTYADGKPSRIVMEGNVDIEHPQAKVKADKADWNFASGILVFSGHPTVSSELLKEMQAETVTIDFNKNTIQATNGAVPEYALDTPTAGGGGAGATGGANGFTEASISDWSGFVTALKAEGKAEGASPGKQIIAQLKKEQQSQLMGTNTDVLVANKGMIVKLLNGVLKSPGLYSEAAWKNVALSEEVKKLLTGKPSGEELVHLNRLLLQAAYPNFIKAS